MTNTISKQEERAVAQSLRAEGADRGVRISVSAASERAAERRKRLSAPRLSQAIQSYWTSPNEREWLW